LFDQLSSLGEALRTQRVLKLSGKSVTDIRPYCHYLNAADKASIAAEISSRRARGDSYGSIARELNRKGLTGRNGGRWYTASVRAYVQKQGEA
jgi:hypothetical protein